MANGNLPPVIGVPKSAATPALRTILIQTVANGFIVQASDRSRSQMPGYDTPSYVFATIDDLAAWLPKQAWQFGD